MIGGAIGVVLWFLKWVTGRQEKDKLRDAWRAGKDAARIAAFERERERQVARQKSDEAAGAATEEELSVSIFDKDKDGG